MTNSLSYKSITIVNDDSCIVNKLETSLIDDARVVVYDHHMFIVLATDDFEKKLSPVGRTSAAQCYKTFYGCNLRVFVARSKSAFFSLYSLQ
jgi:hypothetical protein